MKKDLKIGLYNPYLDVLGGGEKHILSIIEVLAQQAKEIIIFWNKDLSKEIKNRFSLYFINKTKWLPWRSSQLLFDLDYFFYVTDGSYFFSLAKKNFVFCMVPDKKLYQLNLINRIKLWNYKFISNSFYTTKWLKKWGINPITIPPYIDSKFFKNATFKKEKIILSVGRFFPHLHSKNQEKIIETFKLLKLKNPLFKDYKLILVGGLKEEDKNYFNQLKLIAKNDPYIIFKPNVSFDQLYKIYQTATYFWHFTGFGIDEKKHPEQVEHFGIAPLEAAASGCLTFCYNSGGPKEIFSDNKTGYLFKNKEELFKKMTEAETHPDIKEKIIKQAKLMVKRNYSYEIFIKRVKTIL